MPAIGKRTLVATAATVLFIGLGATSIQAQEASQPPTLPAKPNPQTTVPEKVDPPLGTKPSDDPPTGSLSRQLENSNGVIKPPANVDPEIHVPAPVPDPGTTKVIPPPGSPGSTIPVQPR
ncbi:hypothetical protein [uncultured Alsobacter sp.]|uniref:hypothetical protein n=1 Tax=uncultured Alsobacter sp. TaxID=1748258 RepID=UPI0026011315|nr:hypothetical protein [uncultured Alsobacter sp.]